MNKKKIEGDFCIDRHLVEFLGGLEQSKVIMCPAEPTPRYPLTCLLNNSLLIKIRVPTYTITNNIK